MNKQQLVKYIILIVKLLATAILIFFAANNIDFNMVFSILNSVNGVVMLILTTTIVTIQSVIAGYRLKILLSILDVSISNFAGIKNLFLGNFFSQTIISFIGGDAMRVVDLSRSGITIGIATKAIILDRILGSIGLIILFIVAIPFLLTYVHSASLYYGIVVLACLSLCGVIGFFSMGLMPDYKFQRKFFSNLVDFAAVSKHLFCEKYTTGLVILLSCLLHFCNIFTIFLCMHLLGQNISLFLCSIIGAPVMMLSLLPVSIGGWGVREGAMVIGFGLLGVNAGTALTVSIIFGIGSLIASLPGSAVLLRIHKKDYTRQTIIAIK